MRDSQDDTIAAIATPLGVGGVGVIRVSGEGAKAVLTKLFISSNGTTIESHRMLFGWLKNPQDNTKIDQVLACYMQAPKSYTGEDVVEFYCHGGVAILKAALSQIIQSGARLAVKGEFTKRAFLNGKIDLSQAEAVLDLVGAQTQASAGLAVAQLEGRLSKTVGGLRDKLVALCAGLEVAIDFPEDAPEVNYDGLIAQLAAIRQEIKQLIEASQWGKVFREGVATLIVGKPNVGKSSLLNALLEEERAIVTEVAGTTRDTIEELLDIEGLPLRIMDTAGIRTPRDKVEELGVGRAKKEIGEAQFVIIVLDVSQKLSDEDTETLGLCKNKPGVVALNKIDLPQMLDAGKLGGAGEDKAIYKISALRGDGLAELKKGILSAVTDTGVSH
ncbi:MAG: tRNA uridine-5-carboxymethylaminomethyl(34) synthesis GTPase MnmE, partial [Candidatus Saganbacteria bacterium]|nr:tRNA uridine-5-carboxymethylaminomethyl(34) synthesis GTPase MnmE [Candidatus Saganbacteria bacterium]